VGVGKMKGGSGPAELVMGLRSPQSAVDSPGVVK